MNSDTLSKNIEIHMKAIKLCMENHLRIPALILIYAGIDIFSGLGRPAENEFSTREDFIDWCDRYMLHNGNLQCSAIDLYAARCSIIHSSSMHSKLSQNGRAKQLINEGRTKAGTPEKMPNEGRDTRKNARNNVA
jgi:hypothetical protein